MQNMESTSNMSRVEVYPAPRAMSPNVGSEEGVLVNVQAWCQICNDGVHEPLVCAGCGTYGHPACLRTEIFLDYHFCFQCFVRVTAEYATFQDEQRRNVWRQSLQAQITTWRSRAIEAIGLSSTIGVAFGGVVAAAAGAAADLAQGAVQGAAAASSSRTPALSPATPVPAIEQPAPETGATTTPIPPVPVHVSPRRRSRSHEIAPRIGKAHCLVCWKPQIASLRPIAHTYWGDCKLASGILPKTSTERAPAHEGSQYGSAASAQEEGLGGERPRLSAPRSPVAGRPTRPEGLPAPAQEEVPAPSASSSQPPTVEGRLLEVQLELQMLRDDVQNVLKAAHMASEDTQKVMMRMDTLEYEWLLWNDGHQADEAADGHRQPDGVASGRDAVGRVQPSTTTQLAATPPTSPVQHRLTPTPTPRDTFTTDLLGIDAHDPMQQWWDAADLPQRGSVTPPRVRVPLLAPPLAGGGAPLPGADERSANLLVAPPGLDTVAQLSNYSPYGEQPQGYNKTTQALPLPDGQRGGACLVPAPGPEVYGPGVTTDDSDIFSFLAGTRPRTSAEQVLPADGHYSLGNERCGTDIASFRYVWSWGIIGDDAGKSVARSSSQ